jgi:hypothetical protein
MARGVNLGRRSRVDPAGRKRSGGNFRGQRTGVQVVQRRPLHERPLRPTGRVGGRHRRTKRRHGPR